MAKKSSIVWIPFSRKEGHLLEWISHERKEIEDDAKRIAIEAQVNWNKDGIVFVKNYEFTASLKFTGFSFGRSACRAVMVDAKDRKLPLFIQSFSELLVAGKMQGDSTVPCKWTFAKKGQNYGLIWVS